MSHDSTPEDVANLHARDGHLTMLTMDRFEHGELDMTLHDAVVHHLDRCRLCANRFDASHRHAVDLVPPVRAVSAGSSRPMAVAAGLLMAAGLIAVVWPKPQQASLRPASESTLTASTYTTSAAQEQGSFTSIDLRLFTGELAREPLASGDAVSTDNPLHVQIGVDDHGWLAIVVESVQRSDTHPDEGAEDTGGVAPDSTARMLLEPREVRPDEPPMRIMHDLSVDGFNTEERIVAILCPAPFILDPLDAAAGFDVAELSGLPEGCTSQSIHYLPWGRIASS
jgi:hypothetical protein